MKRQLKAGEQGGKMETRKRAKISNIVMVVLIAVIAACAVMAVGHLKGWFGGNDQNSVLTAEKISGVANIERSGVGYSLKENVPLKKGDIVETESGSAVTVSADRHNMVSVNEKSEFAVSAEQKDDIALEMKHGEMFADSPEPGKSFGIEVDSNTVLAGEADTGSREGAVFAVSAQTGSSTVSVFGGELKVIVEDGTEKQLSEGQTLSIVHDSEGRLTAEIGELKIESMDDFMLEQALECDSSDRLCFKADEINKVREKRSAEKAEAKAAAEKQEGISGQSGSESSNSAGSSGGSSSGGGSGSGSVKSCTIEIRCDTILNNMNDLTPGKSGYVPANGVIFATSRVEFTDGETVFEVLKRACSYAGIQLEYSYTPMYGSYYIEGINNLYEFDCGEQSGWMYKVNGWFPNYGCSSYTLKDGDTIVWCYTCNGLGADVGGGVM